MPPSLTAINVHQSQLMAREAHLNQQFHSGAFNPAAKSILPQAQGGGPNQQQASGQNGGGNGDKRRIVKKSKPGASQDPNSTQNQVKLARRQIQFYQKRQAEKHMPSRTPKSAFVTRRLLFKRRARF